MVKGMVYATAGTRRSVVALDAKTGELMWVHSLRRAPARDRPAACRVRRRMVDGRGDGRVVYVTTGYRLVALNAKNGQPIASFGGQDRRLKVGMVTGNGQRIDLETSEAGLRDAGHRQDVVIVGSRSRKA
jgi:quinoprotein glucose dehydrogenase